MIDLDRTSSPEHYLSMALEAEGPRIRLRHASAGLGAAPDAVIESDTRFLLLRQIYTANLELGELDAALETARVMVTVGQLPDIAHHDLARVLWARGDRAEAISAQRLAARAAPADRRSFHRWNLASFQYWADDPAAALDTLGKALRWSQSDRALIRAHQSYIRLATGRPTRRLEHTVDELRASPHGKGYGQFLLGMIHHHMGDDPKARVHLRAFLNRQASADPVKRLALHDELMLARRVLARLESE